MDGVPWDSAQRVLAPHPRHSILNGLLRVRLPGYGAGGLRVHFSEARFRRDLFFLCGAQNGPRTIESKRCSSARFVDEQVM